MFRCIAGFVICAFFLIAEEAPPTYAEQKQQAIDLLKGAQTRKALPLLEKLEAQNPKDDWVAEWLAHGYLILAQTETDPAKRAELVTHAREEANRAKQLGRNTESLNSLLGILANKEPLTNYSENPEVAALLRQGETAFGNGDHKAALEAYAKALAIDPHLYNAAVFSGDVYFREHDWDHAAEWFKRAIAIDPNKDTAYRYWADGLLAQNKFGEAKPLYLDAVVAQPYTRPPWQALGAWAKKANFKVAAPVIQVPAAAAEEDGSGRSAWAAYYAARDPSQTRRTLAQEAEALRAVLTALKQKDISQMKLDPQLAELARIEKAGLLEAWIVLSHADQGIAQDYPAFRSEHRAELTRYLNDEVLRPL